jgi:hypothetical protein
VKYRNDLLEELVRAFIAAINHYRTQKIDRSKRQNNRSCRKAHRSSLSIRGSWISPQLIFFINLGLNGAAYGSNALSKSIATEHHCRLFYFFVTKR